MTEGKSSRRFLSAARPRLMLGGLAAASVTLAGCDRAEPETAQFTTVSECMNAGFDTELCNAARATAEQEYQQSVPKFASQDECEADWGEYKCAPAQTQNVSGGSNIFVPVMAGFVLSNLMQRRYRENNYGSGYYGGGFGRGTGGGPVYRDRSGSSVVLANRQGKTVAQPVKVNNVTIARGGFGGTGMSRGGFGG